MRPVVDNVDSVIGLVGLIISVVTLWKVQSVRRAQENERKLLRMLYGTEALPTRRPLPSTWWSSGP
jgi:hypothetical protein